MPGGELVTVPVPLPAGLTLSRNLGFSVNSAVTSLASVIVTLQLPVPEQPLPDQPEKVEPAPAVALRVTSRPAGYFSVQSSPQSMPRPVTLPLPLPVFL